MINSQLITDVDLIIDGGGDAHLSNFGGFASPER